MVRSVAKQRVSNHVAHVGCPPTSFETAASRLPQDEVEACPDKRRA
jgi:hypothetical protein